MTKPADHFVVPTGVRFLNKNLVPIPKGTTVKVILQTCDTVVSASTISIVLPPVSFGFSKQITENCFVQNYGSS